MSKCLVCKNEFWLMVVKHNDQELIVCRECFQNEASMRRLLTITKGMQNAKVPEVVKPDVVQDMQVTKKPRRKRRNGRIRVPKVSGEGCKVAETTEGGQ